MNPNDLIIAIILSALSGVAGWLIAHMRQQKKITELETTLKLERETATQNNQSLQQTFMALSGDALKSNNQAFLQLARETLSQFHVQARGELTQKEKAIEGLVKPIHEALSRADEQIRNMEKERKEAYGFLHKHLESLTQSQQALHDQTRNLVQALRRPEVRGQWGELTLKRLVELAGMVEHCDFYEQENITTENGRIRPDMIVRLPAGRDIVVDVKTPLDAYLSAIEAGDDSSRKQFLEQHTRNVRERVRELAAKNYWEQFKNSPDFVVMFIPGEQFLSSALDFDHDLLEYALQQKIILATPTSFVALLRAIAFGWRQEQLAANAEAIRNTGEDLYKRLAVFSGHLAKLGSGLGNAVGHFNKAIGSFDSKVIPGARKLAEMGVTERKTLEKVEQIEKAVRDPEDRS